MTVTFTDFTTLFPSFASTPEAQVDFWLGNAYSMLDANRWGDQLDFGVSLYVAHKLTSFANIAKAGGATQSVISSKSAGGLSVSFDTQHSVVDGAGSFNTTSYGVQFYELLLMIGTGGIQLCGPAEYDDGGATGVESQT